MIVYAKMNDWFKVVNATNDKPLAICGVLDTESRDLLLMLKNSEVFIISLDSFEPSGDGTAPDFSDFSIIDCGQTLKFGPYEASVEAVLKEINDAQSNSVQNTDTAPPKC